MEVGFLIRRKAGNAVERNRTRRLFRGIMVNSPPGFSRERGYLFLFHRAYRSTSAVKLTIDQLMSR